MGCKEDKDRGTVSQKGGDRFLIAKKERTGGRAWESPPRGRGWGRGEGGVKFSKKTGNRKTKKTKGKHLKTSRPQRKTQGKPGKLDNKMCGYFLGFPACS